MSHHIDLPDGHLFAFLPVFHMYLLFPQNIHSPMSLHNHKMQELMLLAQSSNNEG